MRFILSEDFLSESKADEQRLIDFAGMSLAKRFFALRQRFKSPENDLYYWIKNKTPQELEQAVSSLENTKSNTQKRKENVSGATLVSESEHWKVYEITTFGASQYYGRDTRWCITGVDGFGDRYWNNYTDYGIEFYFFISKDNYDPRGIYSKVALALYPYNDSYELYDQRDRNCYLKDIPYWEEIQIPGVNLHNLVNQQPYDYMCDVCGALLSENDESYTVNDSIYCSRCFDEYCFICDDCGDECNKDDGHETEYGRLVCWRCYEENHLGESLNEASIDPEGKYTDYGTGKVTSDNIFDDRTHISFFDQLFTNPKYMEENENLKGHIEMISPREYYEICATKIFPNSSVESLIKSRQADPRVLEQIRDIIVKYKRQVFLPYLNYAEQQQEGLHRMLVAAELFGWDHKFPVLIVEWADEELAKQVQKEKEDSRVRKYIKDAVEDTLDYTFDKLEDFIDEIKAQVDYKFDFIDEKVSSFNVKHNDDGTTDVEVNNVVYQFDTDRIKVSPTKSTNIDDIEWDDLEIDETELDDLNDLDIEEFLKKYGLN